MKFAVLFAVSLFTFAAFADNYRYDVRIFACGGDLEQAVCGQFKVDSKWEAFRIVASETHMEELVAAVYNPVREGRVVLRGIFKKLGSKTVFVVR